MRDSRDRNYRQRDRDRHIRSGEQQYTVNSNSRYYDTGNNRGQTSQTQPYYSIERRDSRSPPPLERWERRLRDAKKDHRPRLRNWERGRFGLEGSRAAERFEALRWDDGGRERDRGPIGGMRIARERREELSSRDFWEYYERRRLPVVVSGIPWHEGWRASERWTFGRLRHRSELFAHRHYDHTLAD